MNTKNILIAVGILLALGLGVFNFVRPVQLIQNENQEVGAVVGPNLYNPFWNVNDVFLYPMSKTMTKSTTTICAFKSPNATSTLMIASANFSTGSTTNATVSIAKSSTAFATTTNIGTLKLAANEKGTWVGGYASSSMSNLVFEPGKYLVFGMQGGTGEVNFSPVGTCKVIWQSVEK